jgi:hypothetical protein
MGTDADSELTVMKFDSNIWDVISIVSACSNCMLVFFRISNQIDDQYVEKSSKMLNTSNTIVFIYHFIMLFAIYISSRKGKVYSQFYLYLEDKGMAEVNDKFIIYLNNVWVGFNVVNQMFILDFYFRVIKDNIIRPVIRERFFKGKRFIYSTFLFVILVSLCEIFSFIFDLNTYLIIISMTGMVGVLINYFFPLILFVKFSQRNILSAFVLFRLSMVYVLGVICFSSFFNNIFW